MFNNNIYRPHFLTDFQLGTFCNIYVLTNDYDYSKKEVHLLIILQTGGI